MSVRDTATSVEVVDQIGRLAWKVTDCGNCFKAEDWFSVS